MVFVLTQCQMSASSSPWSPRDASPLVAVHPERERESERERTYLAIQRDLSYTIIDLCVSLLFAVLASFLNL